MLVGDVILHLMFVETGGGDEISSRPETTLGEFFGLLFDPGACFSLEHLRDVGNGIFGWYGDVQMDVIVSDMPCVDIKSFPLRNVLEHALEFLFNEGWCQNASTVFWTPDNMVITHPGGV